LIDDACVLRARANELDGTVRFGFVRVAGRRRGDDLTVARFQSPAKAMARVLVRLEREPRELVANADARLRIGFRAIALAGGREDLYGPSYAQLQAISSFPQIRAVLWFNWRFYEDNNVTAYQPFPIESSATALSAFASGVALPNYVAGGTFTLASPLSKIAAP
jgi:hypothetical protein